MAESELSRVAVRARELATTGSRALGAIPALDQLAAERDTRRRRQLQSLRVDLYALASLVADAAVHRTISARAEAPPYGLLKSGHTDWKMILANPEPVAAGAVGSFLALGKATVDTVVFHLDKEFATLRATGGTWIISGLEDLLALFRDGAPPQTQARMRDAFSFIYGGLHFGTGICVQLVEAMHRVLVSRSGLSVRDEVATMEHSLRPAYRLAGLNVDHVVGAYEGLLEPLDTLPTRAGGSMRWFDPASFMVVESAGRPVRVDLAADLAAEGENAAPTTWVTQGCPARVSSTGGPSPIALLWGWCIELAHDTGLLDRG